MSTVLQMLTPLIAPIATFALSAVVNAIRPPRMSGKAMLLLVGGVSATVTAVDAVSGFVASDPANLVGTFLAGLAATFAHQLLTKIKTGT